MTKKDEIAKKNGSLLPALMHEVEGKITIIRNQEVIADADVAALYGVETREVNQAVRNNPDKFPTHYMFELTNSELQGLRSKILTTNVSAMNRNSTKVFTERGLYMLATILKGERAKAVLKRITLDNLKELVDETLDGDITDVEYTTDDRLTDDDIRQYLRGHWHLEHPTDLQKKEKTDRNEILKITLNTSSLAFSQ